MKEVRKIGDVSRKESHATEPRCFSTLDGDAPVVVVKAWTSLTKEIIWKRFRYDVEVETCILTAHVSDMVWS